MYIPSLLEHFVAPFHCLHRFQAASLIMCACCAEVHSDEVKLFREHFDWACRLCDRSFSNLKAYAAHCTQSKAHEAKLAAKINRLPFKVHSLTAVSPSCIVSIGLALVPTILFVCQSKHTRVLHDICMALLVGLHLTKLTNLQ